MNDQKMTYEELAEQLNRQALKAAAYREELSQAHDRLAESRSLYMNELQKRQNLEQEIERLKKELQEERLSNSQAEDEATEEEEKNK
ncbi:hypothetical protein [Bacillus licheniformis]|uniref:hypothetical protein n=1 Tax=Bacillus licheniformis TaxID=1402 RepID=UPI000472B830|nr:hypothetical protein [Bacillus licheniformis]OLQ45221.1 hypothetical protein BHT96_18700 [Bacillus licheniformis]TWJ84369.1 hypothetical protein CHCC20496_4371 [Bacillus licheniformis]